MAKLLSVSLLGFGFSARTWHVPFLFHHNTKYQLKYIATRQKAEAVRDELRTIAAAQNLQIEVGNIVLISDYDSLTHDSNYETDVIVICTPSQEHFRSVNAVLRHLKGRKMIICEKPLTVSTLGAASLFGRLDALKSESRIHVFHNRRYDSDFLTLKCILEFAKVAGVKLAIESNSEGRNDSAGEIREKLGQIEEFKAFYPPVLVEYSWHKFRPKVQDRWRERDREGGGLWYDLAPHMVDQVLLLFGKPEKVHGMLNMVRSGSQTDDLTIAVFRYSLFTVVLTVSSVVEPTFVSRWKVYGRNGLVLEKRSMDPQEEHLRARLYPGTYTQYGCDLEPFHLLIPGRDPLLLSPLTGCQHRFYEDAYDGFVGNTPGPNTREQVLAVCELVESVWLDSKHKPPL